MSDLVDRELVLKGQVIHYDCDGVEVLSGYAVPVDYIKKLPSAQPEIIRCNDCKHWQQILNSSYGHCESDDMWRSLYGETTEVNYIETAEDHYCGYAERKKDE